MNSNELHRYLKKLGASFESGKGSHLKVFLNGKMSILPMHGSKELPKGTEKAILKQLGLGDRDKK
jgi:mRNA interferase HicA